MDFSLSQEQSLLKDSIDKFIRDETDVERHRRLGKTEAGFDPASWQQFAELGWLSVPFAEDVGGFGGNAIDVMVVAQALGQGLVREPFLSNVVTCGGFLSRGGSPAQQQNYIPAIIDGSKQWAFAFAETNSRYNLASVSCRADKQGEGFVINGEKIAVLNGHIADYLVVTARTAGADTDVDGISVFIIDVEAKGLSRQVHRSLDGSYLADIRLENVALTKDSLLGDAGAGLALVESVIDDSIVAMGAEALGSMQSLLDTTVEYTKTREQFGQPIGKFQALQHRMADMYLKLEETRSLLLDAAIQKSENSPEAARACAALKVKLAEAGRFIAQQAVQLHGGIGMTDELIVGHHFKRLHVLAMLYGDEDYYLQRYARLSA